MGTPSGMEITSTTEAKTRTTTPSSLRKELLDQMAEVAYMEKRNTSRVIQVMYPKGFDDVQSQMNHDKSAFMRLVASLVVVVLFLVVVSYLLMPLHMPPSISANGHDTTPTRLTPTIRAHRITWNWLEKRSRKRL